MTTNCRSVRRCSALCAIIILLVAALPFYAQEPAKSPEISRLIDTAKIWIAVKYFHPYLAYKPIDWDKALIDALPKIRAAKTNDEYASALGSMLDVLHDPDTRVNATFAPAQAAATLRRTWVHRGFTPETGEPKQSFYASFQYAVTPWPVTTEIPAGPGVFAQIRLDQLATRDGDAPVARPDSYPPGAYPSTEYRILAVFKIWGVIHHFFAYRDLMDEDWDDVFASFLPRFIAAKDAREYNLTVAEMMAHTLDSNVSVSSDELNQYFGTATVGLRLRLVERKPVITEILDAKASDAGVHVGDIVARVDGNPVAQRFNRIQDYICGSTAQRRGYDSLQLVLNGAEGSTAKLMIATQDGTTKEIELQRTIDFTKAPTNERKSTPIHMLAGNIGYADLTRLPDDQFPAIFEEFQSATGIIFDARGPVSPAARSIAAHLTSATDVAGAIITGPVALSPDVPTTRSLTDTASYFFVEKVPSAATPQYKGKTAMLIDERTIGAAEHLGLWLEAANNTAFIGSPSAGADGETSNFILPGGILVTFSGQDVRHGNSGKLQRLGLQPAVVVTPSINGIGQHRDEELDKAVEYLSAETHTTRAALR